MRISRLRRMLLVGLLTGLIAPASSAAAPPANDFWTSPQELRLNTQFVNQTNVDATFGEGDFEEPYTPAGPLFCDTREMGATVWYRIQGTGGPVRVTVEPNFDAMVAVYDPNNNAIDCDDRFFGTESLAFQSTAGATHLVQVGGLWNSTTMTAATGGFNFTALANDDSGFPDTVQEGTAVKSNVGAGEQDGELLSCRGTGYHSTVWFRYVAPELGTVTFLAAGHSVAVAVYRGGQLVDCNTSGPGSELGASTSVNVSQGQELRIQVGGLLVPGERNFNYTVTFSRNCDADGDGAFDQHRDTCRGVDCNDGRGDIRPGLPDLVNNDVDENCDNLKDYDRDGDGYRVTVPVPNPKPTNWDCNDNPGIGRRINPGQRDVRGNKLNEDCKGRAAKALGLPSSVTDFWKPRRGGVFVARMQVKPVLARTRVKVTCRGPGCPFKQKDRLAKRRAKAMVLTGLFRKRVLRTGASVVVKVLPPSGEWIGRSESYRIRGTSVTAKKGCLNVRGRKVKCP